VVCVDGLSGFDGPPVGYSAMSFEYEGDRDAGARLPLAIPQDLAVTEPVSGSD
jgi:hypothetical protein